MLDVSIEIINISAQETVEDGFSYFCNPPWEEKGLCKLYLLPSHGNTTHWSPVISLWVKSAGVVVLLVLCIMVAMK